MFTYLFGGAIAGSTGAYLQYILPGILVMSVLFTTVYSGVALNTDMTKGVVDRFRSLPIWRPAPLVGALLGDSVRYVVAGTVIDRARRGPRLPARARASPGVVAALRARRRLRVRPLVGVHDARPGAALAQRGHERRLHGDLPADVPEQRLRRARHAAGPLEAFVDVNPISLLVTASRGLMDGNADRGRRRDRAREAAALTAVFAPLTTRLYRRG